MNQEAFLSSQAALYARVSSKEQEREGYSIPAQRKLLRSYAQRQDYQVVREFVDVETAKQSGRTQFSRMARFLQEHPQVRILLCEKTDRLYRNFKDYVTIDELEVTLVFVKEGSVLNRQSRSHVFPAYAPLGYRHERGRKRIMLDLKRAPLIREMFERYAAGSTSMRALEAHLALAGLVTRKGQAGELQHGGRQAVCGQAPAAHRQGSVRAGAGGHPYPQSHATDGARFCLHGPVEVRRVRRRLPAGGGAGGQFAGILRQLQFSETVFDWTREALRLSQQEKAAFHRRAIEGLNAQYLKLQNRIRQRIQHHRRPTRTTSSRASGCWRSPATPMRCSRIKANRSGPA